MRTDSTDYAGICRKVVMPTVITAGTGKTVGEDAEFEVLVKRLADVGAWRMVIALAVELADACQLRPGLEVFGYRLLKQGSLGVAYYVSIIPFGRVLIKVGFDSKKQGWHDKLAGTFVITDHRSLSHINCVRILDRCLIVEWPVLSKLFRYLFVWNVTVAVCHES